MALPKALSTLKRGVKGGIRPSTPALHTSTPRGPDPHATASEAADEVFSPQAANETTDEAANEVANEAANEIADEAAN